MDFFDTVVTLLGLYSTLKTQMSFKNACVCDANADQNRRDIVAMILRGATLSRQQTKLSLVRIAPLSFLRLEYLNHCFHV